MHLFYVTYCRKIKSDAQHAADSADELFLRNREPAKCVKPFLEPLSEALTILNLLQVTPPAGFDFAQDLTLGFIEWCAVVTTTTPHDHECKMYIYIHTCFYTLYILAQTIQDLKTKKCFAQSLGGFIGCFNVRRVLKRMKKSTK